MRARTCDVLCASVRGSRSAWRVLERSTLGRTHALASVCKRDYDACACSLLRVCAKKGACVHARVLSAFVSCNSLSAKCMQCPTLMDDARSSECLQAAVSHASTCKHDRLPASKRVFLHRPERTLKTRVEAETTQRNVRRRAKGKIRPTPRAMVPRQDGEGRCLLPLHADSHATLATSPAAMAPHGQRLPDSSSAK
eukprot:6213311-Pleurochrysis_carterae.AAC.14